MDAVNLGLRCSGAVPSNVIAHACSARHRETCGRARKNRNSLNGAREQKRKQRPWQPNEHKIYRTPSSITSARARSPLTIFLVNGVKLQGVVTWFDNFCVLLRRDGHSQLVYKHAISTIMPGHPIQLFEGAEEAPRKRSDWSPDVATRALERLSPPAGSGSGTRDRHRALSAGARTRRGARAARGRAQRSPQARLDEAVGLARAIDLDVVERGHRHARRRSAPPPISARARSRRSPAS